MGVEFTYIEKILAPIVFQIAHKKCPAYGQFTVHVF